MGDLKSDYEPSSYIRSFPYVCFCRGPDASAQHALQNLPSNPPMRRGTLKYMKYQRGQKSHKLDSLQHNSDLEAEQVAVDSEAEVHPRILYDLSSNYLSCVVCVPVCVEVGVRACAYLMMAASHGTTCSSRVKCSRTRFLMQTIGVRTLEPSQGSTGPMCFFDPH